MTTKSLSSTFVDVEAIFPVSLAGSMFDAAQILKFNVAASAVLEQRLVEIVAGNSALQQMSPNTTVVATIKSATPSSSGSTLRVHTEFDTFFYEYAGEMDSEFNSQRMLAAVKAQSAPFYFVASLNPGEVGGVGVHSFTLTRGSTESDNGF